MYKHYFGFTESPFNLTPDPRYLFLSRYHKQALDHLLYGIQERKGFIIVTGGIGTGKTTLCRSFLGHLDEDVKSALILNSFVSDSELLKTINQEFDIKMSPGAETRKDYIDALNHFLLENHRNGGNAVLLIDEAQNLSHSVLEQIRMLSNLETEKEKLIQIILVGQPELRDVLCAPSLKQLDERITVRYDLGPLDHEDIKGYVSHRLVVAGNKGDLSFSKGALKKIFSYSRGNPRRINAVCDRALLIAYALEKYTVTGKMIVKAIGEIRGSSRSGYGINRLPAKALGVIFFFSLLTTIAAFGVWTFKDKISDFFIKEKKITVIKTVSLPRKPDKPPKISGALFLDEKNSLTEMFRIFNNSQKTSALGWGGNRLELATLTISPEYYTRFSKPFRITYTGHTENKSSSPNYLLVKRITPEGAIMIDSQGNEIPVPADFVLKNGDTDVTWFHPYASHPSNLTEGIHSDDILNIQRVLMNAGYNAELSAVYDINTLAAIKQFQRDFGLIPDGIIGPQTMAVLYLMGQEPVRPHVVQ